jgi:ABC-2 type transport system permease protein
VCGSIVIGKFGSLNGEFGSYVLKTLGIELFLYIALTALLLMVAMTVKNLGGVIAIGVIGIISFENVLFALLELAVDGRIKFSEFSLIYNTLFYRMNMEAAGSDYIRSLIVGTVFLLAATTFGIFMFKKSDVK